MNTKHLTSKGKYNILLTASYQYIKRTVYIDTSGDYYIRYYGRLVKVVRGRFYFIL